MSFGVGENVGPYASITMVTHNEGMSFLIRL
jgi:hypothetical protein